MTGPHTRSNVPPPPAGVTAAEASEDQERAERYRHRIQRVAEEQGELLDEGDFHEHEGEADGGEVGHDPKFEPGQSRIPRASLAPPRHP
ncbi:hypothetical protein D3C78_1100900 [compost metagenome]